MSAGERIPSSTRGAAVVSEEADVVMFNYSFFFPRRRRFLFCRRLKTLYHRFARMVATNDLDPLLGTGQAILANLHQFHPFLVATDQFFQHHFAGFHLVDDLLESIYRAFKV